MACLRSVQPCQLHLCQRDFVENAALVCVARFMGRGGARAPQGRDFRMHLLDRATCILVAAGGFARINSVLTASQRGGIGSAESRKTESRPVRPGRPAPG